MDDRRTTTERSKNDRPKDRNLTGGAVSWDSRSRRVASATVDYQMVIRGPRTEHDLQGGMASVETEAQGQQHGGSSTKVRAHREWGSNVVAQAPQYMHWGICTETTTQADLG